MKHLSIIAIIVLLTSLVLAAGSSTTTEPEETSPPPVETPTPPEAAVEEAEAPSEQASVLSGDCESKATLQLRVKCRLVNHVENDGAPEACRGPTIDEDYCDALYKASDHCYTLIGQEKSTCFFEESGVRGRAVSEVARADPRAVRGYIVLLLYDLQERVEIAYGNGAIGSSPASSLISQIVQIKKALLSGTSKTEVQLLMDRFKDQWAEEMP